MQDSRRNGRNVSSPDLSKIFDTLPPHSLEAEMCLLGSLILAGVGNVHVVGEVMQVVAGPADFYLPKHASIYEGVAELYDRNAAVDIVQLAQWLKDRGHYEAIGKEDYLVELAESVPTAINAVHYAKTVRDKAIVRRLMDAAAETLREAATSTAPPMELVDAAERRIFDLAEHQVQSAEAVDMGELVQQTLDAMQAAMDGPRGVPTGYVELDDLLNGLQAGEMIVLAARPSMGKTALALNIAEYAAVVERIPTAVLSLEMSRQQLGERVLCSRSSIDSQRLRRNQLDETELQRVQAAAAELSDAPLFIDDTPGLSITQARAKARRLAARHGIKLLVIDYLQLMRSPGSENRQQEVSEISRGIKALARELRVPVVILSQLNRQNEGRADKRPMLSDLRESGAIEQDADVVMLLHREDYYHRGEPDYQPTNTAELNIAKNRNGPVGVVKLHYQGASTRFETAAPGYLEGQYAGF